LRTFYGMRNDRVVHTEAIRMSDHEQLKDFARSRLRDFDLVEIWDGAILRVRMSRSVDKADILQFNSDSTKSEVGDHNKAA
jgi:hypothetical protein